MLGERSGGGNFYPDSAKYLALNAGKDQVLAELFQTYERHRTGQQVIDLAAGVSLYDLPNQFVRLTRASVLSSTGGDYIIIEEGRHGEAMVGEILPGHSSGITSDTVYELEANQIRLTPPPNAPVTAGLRIHFEQDLDELLVGNPHDASGANTLLLARSVNEAIGQREASDRDDVYIGVSFTILNGPGAGETLRCIDYDGATRTCTMASAWAVAPTSASVYSAVSPLPRMTDPIIRHWAAMSLLGDSGEDPSHHAQMFESTLERWMEVLDTRTPGHQIVRPFDEEGDL